MANVDPYVIKIPQAFLSDPEVARWFEYDNRWKHDMWIRSGGGSDAVEEGESVFNTNLSGSLFALQRRVGSGVAVTIDTSGFTVDTTEQTTDMTEM